jgi:hypothetical protein
MLMAFGLKAGTVTTAISGDSPAGTVINKAPPAGTELVPGQTIDLVISTAPPPKKVEDPPAVLSIRPFEVAPDEIRIDVEFRHPAVATALSGERYSISTLVLTDNGTQARGTAREHKLLRTPTGTVTFEVKAFKYDTVPHPRPDVVSTTIRSCISGPEAGPKNFGPEIACLTVPFRKSWTER